MSEDQTKIQVSSKEELAGGQHSLKDERVGTEGLNQNTLSFCRGENVESSSNPYSGKARNDLNHGAQVAGRQLERAKPTDAKNVGDGSYPGDTRQTTKKLGDVAGPSITQAANGQGGPRSPRGQFPQNRADTNNRGGSFGNQHADGSWPDPADANN